MTEPISNIYTSSLRTVSIVFGALFDNIKLRVFDRDGNYKTERLTVPIVFSNKSAYFLWLEQKMRQPDGRIEVGRFLPRISYEMVGLSMDTQNRSNPALSYLTASAKSEHGRIRVPNAYQFSYNMSVWTNKMSDGIEIMDQILPLFAPEVSIKINEVRDTNVVNDVRVVLNSVSLNDNYLEGTEVNRLMEWTLNFDVFAHIVPTEEEAVIINKTVIDLQNAVNQRLSRYVSEGYDPEYMDYSKIEDRIYDIGDEIPDKDNIVIPGE